MEVKKELDINKCALQVGTILDGRYQIDGILGEGGFGITYEGRELERNKKVAVKEYFPAELATRENADSTQNLHIFRGKNEEFEKGKQRFLEEAETLRKFHYLEGIVSVLDCFEENRIAYIVMEYIDGITLKQYVKENGCLSFTELIPLFEPVMKALIKIHRQGLIHRDISPDNLMIGMDNKMRLIDFGAAKAANEKYKKAATVILKSGYAPPEQYLSEGKQGSWTDVYALSATMYMALTGHIPVDSVARLQGKELSPSIDEIDNIADWQIRAIEQGMEIKVSKRFKNVEELWDAITVAPRKEDEVTVQRPVASRRISSMIKGNGRLWRIASSILILCVVLVLAGLIAAKGNTDRIAGVLRGNTTQEKTAEVDSRKDTEEKREEAFNEYILCKMPDVTGLEEQEAMERIAGRDSQIKIIVEREYDAEAKKGIVMRQSVEPDTQYNIGAIKEIILTVSKGAEDTATQQEKSNAVKKAESTTEAKKDDIHIYEDDGDYEEFWIED